MAFVADTGVVVGTNGARVFAATVATFESTDATVVDLFTSACVDVDVLVDILAVEVVVVVVEFVNSGNVRKMPKVVVGWK